MVEWASGLPSRHSWRDSSNADIAGQGPTPPSQESKLLLSYIYCELVRPMHKVAFVGFLVAIRLTAAEPGDRAVAVLQQRCWTCHGEKMAMSGLRLDSRAAALKGG